VSTSPNQNASNKARGAERTVQFVLASTEEGTSLFPPGRHAIGGTDLSRWAQRLRRAVQRGRPVAASTRQALQTLPDWAWDADAAEFGRGLTAFRHYRDDARPAPSDEEWDWLSRWVRRQHRRWENGERGADLLALDGEPGWEWAPTASTDRETADRVSLLVRCENLDARLAGIAAIRHGADRRTPYADIATQFGISAERARQLDARLVRLAYSPLNAARWDVLNVLRAALTGDPQSLDLLDRYLPQVLDAVMATPRDERLVEELMGCDAHLKIAAAFPGRRPDGGTPLADVPEALPYLPGLRRWDITTVEGFLHAPRCRLALSVGGDLDALDRSCAVAAGEADKRLHHRRLPVADLGVSRRTRRVLAAAGYTNFGDFPDNLPAVRGLYGIGRVARIELDAALGRLGLGG
jgi:hypothetical protein